MPQEYHLPESNGPDQSTTVITGYGENADHRDAGNVSLGPFDMLHEESKLSCIQRSIICYFWSIRVAATVKICQQLGGDWRAETDTRAHIPYKRTR